MILQCDRMKWRLSFICNRGMLNKKRTYKNYNKQCNKNEQ